MSQVMSDVRVTIVGGATLGKMLMAKIGGKLD